jgi:hypothetical protein
MPKDEIKHARILDKQILANPAKDGRWWHIVRDDEMDVKTAKEIAAAMHMGKEHVELFVASDGQFYRW